MGEGLKNTILTVGIILVIFPFFMMIINEIKKSPKSVDWAIVTSIMATANLILVSVIKHF